MDLHPVILAVRDLYGQELFYRHLLGFGLACRHLSRSTPGLRTVVLDRGAARLELRWQEGRLADGAPGHLAFPVEDVDREHARLAVLGVDGLEAPRDTGDGRREALLRDPEGNLVGLWGRLRPPPRPITAAIFDLDGTLVDSEENYFEADRLLLEERGIVLSREVKAQYVGRSNDEVLGAFRERFGLADPVATLVARKNELYLELARRHTAVFPKMAEFARGLRALGLPLAVASGSSPGVLAAILEQTGLAPLFPIALSSEGGRSKPSPDLFLETARRLGVEPDGALVVEDSQHGVEAAVRAFMPCIAVPFQTPPPLPPAFCCADLLFETGMTGFDPEAALAFVRARLAEGEAPGSR